jgi:hypothetical protein
MRFEKLLDGVSFTGDCANGIFTRGTICCPNCKHELQQQVTADNDAELICPQGNKGCVKPTMSFGSSEDMTAWTERGWDAMAWVCKQSPIAT